MKIESQEATIKTANVEIKTLSVSGKQVTLAVFRQLDNLDLVDPKTTKLNGIPWGRINYHPDKCQSDSEHLHVVWQKGNKLYRNNIFANIQSNQNLRNIKQAQEITARAYLATNCLSDIKLAETLRFDLRNATRSIFSIDVYIGEEFRSALSYYLSPEKDSSKLYNYINSQWHDDTNPTLKEIELTIMELKAEEQKFQDNWNEQYEMLSSLEHLFIAV